MYNCRNYNKIFALDLVSGTIDLGDHLAGFGPNYENAILDHLNNIAKETLTVYHDQIATDNQKSRYPNLEFKLKLWTPIWDAFVNYNRHPKLNYKNFICSFNGSPHVSRKLLTAILERFGYFNINYCSKNFSFSTATIDGHIQDYVTHTDKFYRKFFIGDNSERFFQTTYSFGHNRYNHDQNIYNLESKLTESFLHIVSETIATSYVPFVTEKFLYSIATRGLFLAYAQPGWHDHIEKYYGFKKYTKLFDYKFDTIQNPVERLVELITMISKFKNLSPIDWRDLYLLELDTVEYNYDHYFSGRYLEHLKQYE